MTTPFLSRSRARFRICLAFAGSALLHGAALAFAELHDHPAPLAEMGSSWDAFPEVVLEPSEPSPPPDSPDLSPPPPPEDPPLFADVAPTVAPQPSKLSRIPKPPRQPSTTTAPRSARALAVHAPLPAYPYEARRARTTGEGVAVLSVDPATGHVLSVAMTRSTGSAVLDDAAISGLRRWRFRPGTPAQVRCPITYTLTGAAL